MDLDLLANSSGTRTRTNVLIHLSNGSVLTLDHIREASREAEHTLQGRAEVMNRNNRYDLETLQELFAQIGGLDEETVVALRSNTNAGVAGS